MIGFTFYKHLMETFILSIGFLEVKAGSARKTEEFRKPDETENESMEELWIANICI